MKVMYNRTKEYFPCRQSGAAGSLLKAPIPWRSEATGTFPEKRCAWSCCDRRAKRRAISSARTECSSMIWARLARRANALPGRTRRHALPCSRSTTGSASGKKSRSGESLDLHHIARQVRLKPGVHVFLDDLFESDE